MVNKHVVVVLDATGSMSGEEERVVTSLNEYVEALPKKCNLTVFMFDSNRWDTFFSDKVKKWKKIERSDYQPGAMTPLYDSIAKGIEYAKSISSKGDKVMFMVDTDGYENASTDYNFEKIQKMIEKCKGKGWAFKFMASSLTEQGAMKVGNLGTKLGVNTKTYAYSNRGASYRSFGLETVNYLDDKDQAKA